MKNRIFILVGNPVKKSFSYMCADVYEKMAIASGSDVRRFNIGEMDFDPSLHNGYEVIQELEPDLIRFQEAVSWADHLVFVYPNWWSSMPAKMKGAFDRAFLPGFAFSFSNGRLKPLLSGKTSRIINIIGSSSPIKLWLSVGSYTNELSHGILKECGISIVDIKSFGPTRNISDEKRDYFLAKVKGMAEIDSVG